MEALDKLIEIMCSELVLALPNFDLDFKVTSDASDLGYGAVLEQEIEEKERSISYFSKCYTLSQKNYSTSEKELLGIVMAVEHWSSYLYGKKFIIYSDHKPLAWMLNKNHRIHDSKDGLFVWPFTNSKFVISQDVKISSQICSHDYSRSMR